MIKRVSSLFFVLIFMLGIFGAMPALQVEAASNLADSAFFGVWDGAQWTTAGKLNYNYTVNGVKVLADVETAVKAANGDYSNAESALYTYFKNRTHIKVPDTLAENKGLADLAVRNTFLGPSSDYLIDTMTFSDSYSTVATDIQATIKANLGKGNQVSVMLMGAFKEDSVAEIFSKEVTEASKKPTITVVIGGISYDIVADKDTYITGSSATTNGSATSLLVRDSGTLAGGTSATFDANTYRTYINFNLSSLPQDGTIDSATLKLYGKNKSSGNKTLNLFSIGSSTWSEATYNWSGITTGNIYSWNNVTGGTDWSKPTGADAEYLNVICRFYYLQPMVYEHLKNPTETVYADNAVRLMNDFLTDRAAGYNRTLETGIRTGNWIMAYDLLKNTSSINAEDNKKILKFLWQEGNFLNTTSNWTSGTNWGMIQTNGFFKVATYFPELTDSASWLSTANSRLLYMAQNQIKSDYTFGESTTSYASYVLQLYLECKQFAVANNQSIDSTIDAYLKGLAKSLMDLSYPNGYDANYGDSNYSDNSAMFYATGQAYNDAGMKYFGSKGKEGSVPSYTSSFFPIGNYANMRSGWDKSDLFMMLANNNFTNNGHGHPDHLTVNVYAYDRPLLIDPGRYTYTSSDPIRQFLVTTKAHNTIEVGATSQSKGASTAKTYWNTNKGADFYEGYTNGTTVSSNVWRQTRSVLFVKPGFWIVSDYVNNTNTATAGTALTDFKQTWHYMPNAEPTINDTTKKISTNFSTGANIQIVPADPTELDRARPADSGYYSDNYGLAQVAKYSAIIKLQRSKATFDTILYPTKQGETKNVQVNRLTTSPYVSTDVATALKVNIDGTLGDYGYYYLSHEVSPKTSRAFDVYSFDGKTAYVQTDNSGAVKSASVVGGKTLKKSSTNLISSTEPVDDVSVNWKESTLEISGGNIVLNDEPTSQSVIAIYAPNATNVTFDGISVKYSKVGDYIYAVGVPKTSASVQTFTYKPVEDSYTADNTTTPNGSSNQLHVKNSGPARKTYIKFNMGSLDTSNVGTAKLRLYAEVASLTANKAIVAYPITDEAWTEDNITWANSPTVGTTAIDTTNVGGAGAWYEWDLTSYIKDHADSIASVALVMTTVANNDNKIFSSNQSENQANIPQLVVSTVATQESNLANVTSTQYFIDNTKMEINEVGEGVTIEQFIANINASNGAVKKVYNSDGIVRALSGSIANGMILNVTSEDGSVEKNYVIHTNISLISDSLIQPAIYNPSGKSISIAITNKGTSKNTYTLIVAKYNSIGSKLASVKAISKNIISGTSDSIVVNDITVNSGEQLIIYMWDDINGMKPLTKEQILQY